MKKYLFGSILSGVLILLSVLVLYNGVHPIIYHYALNNYVELYDALLVLTSVSMISAYSAYIIGMITKGVISIHLFFYSHKNEWIFVSGLIELFQVIMMGICMNYLFIHINDIIAGTISITSIAIMILLMLLMNLITVLYQIYMLYKVENQPVVIRKNMFIILDLCIIIGLLGINFPINMYFMYNGIILVGIGIFGILLDSLIQFMNGFNKKDIIGILMVILMVGIGYISTVLSLLFAIIYLVLILRKEDKIVSKIVFLDVDGTLINYEAKLPASAADAVNKARANGHKVYICTGCSKAEIEQRNLCDLDGMIGGNGAYVEDAGEVVLHQGLSKEECKHIVDWCNERHLGFYLEANSGMYCNDWMLEQGPETMTKYGLGKGADVEKAKKSADSFVNSFIHLTGEDLYRDDVNKISFILSSYQDHLDSKVEFPTLEANTWGGKDELALFGDLGPAGITKKTAIEALLEHLGADQKDTISFGDAKIDLSMFELCAYNVAMGNGGKEIKEAADYITDDVDEDGLYNAFKHLGLIDQ